MIPRRLRLGREGFEEAATGRRATSAHFSVTARKTAKNGGIAAVISKKTAKRSVDRHLLRRRMLALLAPLASPTRSLIVYARAGSPSLSYAAIREELLPLIERAIGAERVVR